MPISASLERRDFERSPKSGVRSPVEICERRNNVTGSTGQLGGGGEGVARVLFGTKYQNCCSSAVRTEVDYRYFESVSFHGYWPEAAWFSWKMDVAVVQSVPVLQYCSGRA